MGVEKLRLLKKGSKLIINNKSYNVIDIIIPAEDIEDRARHVLNAVQHVKEPDFVRDFKLKDRFGKEYMLKVVDRPTYFWDLNIGFREEGLIDIESIEVR